jgi:hypothetical protein
MSSPDVAAPVQGALAADADSAQVAVRLRDWAWITLLGLFLIVFGLVIISFLIALWPSMIEAAQATKPKAQTAAFSWFGHRWVLSADAALLLAVVLVSALGSFVHAATSFSDYAGNRQLRVSWIWWYVLRALVGSSLALVFYFSIRGGFFTGTSTKDLNPYGMAAVAGLVGLFSKQATDKLREIFDTAFRVGQGYGDDTRKDGIKNPAPMLQGSEPAELVAGGALEIDLRGEGFIRESVVQVRRVGEDTLTSVPRKTEYAGPTRLRVLLERKDIESAGMLALTVVNPEPGGGTSATLKLAVGGGAAEVPADGGPSGPHSEET